jgi:hypothetical protein
VTHVVIDKICVQRDGRRRSGAGGGDDLGTRINGVAGDPDSGNVGASGAVSGDPAVADLAAKLDEQVTVRDEVAERTACRAALPSARLRKRAMDASCGGSAADRRHARRMTSRFRGTAPNGRALFGDPDRPQRRAR